jgi:hypothetical protein
VVRAFSILKATDLPSYLRLRHAAKKANRGCSVTVLDKLVRAERMRPAIPSCPTSCVA